MVNVTMLCANRPRLLKQALDSIGDLSAATVTIRDAGMSPEVGNIACEWMDGRENTCYVLTSGPLGTGPARNRVIKMSEKCFGRGDYLYISDDDVCFLRENWLRILTNTYAKARDAGFRVVGAYNHPFNQPCSPPFPITKGSYTLCNVNEVYAVASQSMLMDWATWDEFGPFCDTPAGKVCQSEDVDFCNRIRAAGFKVGVISPALLVNTGITNSFGEHIPGWEIVKSHAPQGVIVE